MRVYQRHVQRTTPPLLWKSHLEMIKVIFTVFILPYKPLQEFKEVSAPFLGPAIEEEKLLKAYSPTQSTSCMDHISGVVQQMLYGEVLPLPGCVFNYSI